MQLGNVLGFDWAGDAAAEDGAFIGYLALSGLAGLLLVVVGALFLYLRGRWTAIAAEAIARRLRDELYRRLHYLPASFFDAADTGDLVQRCSSDVETMRVFLTSHVVEIGRSVLLVVVMVPIIFSRDARLAWLAVCLMPFLAIGAFLFFSRVRRQFQVADEAEGAMTAVLQENLAGIRVVRAFARQEHEIGRFGASNGAYRDAFYRVNTLEAWYWGISNALAMAQLGVVLIAGGYFLAAGSISVGELFVFVNLVTMVVYPVRRLGEVLTDSSKAIVALGRINHILEAEEESRERPPERARAVGAVVFDTVRAGYKPDRAAVVDFSAHIPAGQTVGIVGPPGSGKTTLVRLLMRLYPFHTGRILVDGVDVREVDRQWLRQQIGVVLQDPFLYSRSIAANLRVARPNAAESELHAAAQEAAVHDAILDFPAGLRRADRRARPHPLRRPAATAGAGPRTAQGTADSGAGRFPFGGGHGHRAAHSRSVGRASWPSHHHRHRASPVVGAPRRPHLGDGARSPGAGRHPRRAGGRPRPLSPPVRHPRLAGRIDQPRLARWRASRNRRSRRTQRWLKRKATTTNCSRTASTNGPPRRACRRSCGDASSATRWPIRRSWPSWPRPPSPAPRPRPSTR